MHYKICISHTIFNEHLDNSGICNYSQGQEVYRHKKMFLWNKHRVMLSHGPGPLWKRIAYFHDALFSFRQFSVCLNFSGIFLKFWENHGHLEVDERIWTSSLIYWFIYDIQELVLIEKIEKKFKMGIINKKNWKFLIWDSEFEQALLFLDSFRKISIN